MFGGLLPNPFSSSQLFSTDHLSILSNCLKVAFIYLCLANLILDARNQKNCYLCIFWTCQESTFCQPRVHGVWPALINILLPDTISQEDAASASSSLRKQKKSRKSCSSEDELVKNLGAFCEIIIEGSLLLSSHDRKHLALDVLFLLLQKLSASFLPIVLSSKVVQCLMDILSTDNSWLYKVAQHALHFFHRKTVDLVILIIVVAKSASVNLVATGSNKSDAALVMFATLSGVR